MFSCLPKNRPIVHMMPIAKVRSLSGTALKSEFNYYMSHI